MTTTSNISSPISLYVIDNRAVRFSAAITSLVTATAFLTVGSAISTWLLALQSLIFAFVVFFGFRYSLYGAIFRAAIAHRLTTAAKPEPVTPARFAQSVGLVCASTALLASFIGSIPIAGFFAGVTFVASFLNAAFNFCLGCELYAIGLRIFK